MSSGSPRPDTELASAIISENIAHHEVEAGLYDLSHTELTHAFQRSMLRHDLDLVQERLRGVERPLAMDVGAGTGRLTLAFARRGWDVLSLDNSPAMLEVLTRRYAALPAPKGALETVAAGADDFDPAMLKGRPLHLVGFSSVLHHLPDYLKVLSEMGAALAPGGLLYVTQEPLPAQVSRKTVGMRLLSILDQILRAPQQIRKQIVRRRLGLKSPRSRQSLVDYHDKAGLDVAAIAAVLAEQGLEVILQRPYKDRKTALVGVLDTYVFKTPNWRFRLVACKTKVAAVSSPESGFPGSDQDD